MAASNLRIVLLGKTGVGKSASANTILGTEEFVEESSPESVTRQCSSSETKVSGRKIEVADTPGLFDTSLTNEELRQEIVKCVYMTVPGPHVFLLVISLRMRFTEEERNTMKWIQENFSKLALKYAMVLFTNMDGITTELDEYIDKSPALKQLISECGGRYHSFDNKKRDRAQVSRLLTKIDKMVAANGGQHYTDQMYQEAQRKIREEEERKRKEEERKRQEEERKRQEEQRRREEALRQELERQERQRREEDRKRFEEEKKQRVEEERMRREEDRKEYDRRRMEERKMFEEQERKKEEARRREWDKREEQHQAQMKKSEEENKKRLQEERERREQEKRDNERMRVQEKKMFEEQEKKKEEAMKREWERREGQLQAQIKKSEEENKKMLQKEIERMEQEKRETERRIKEEQERKRRDENPLNFAGKALMTVPAVVGGAVVGLTKAVVDVPIGIFKGGKEVAERRKGAAGEDIPGVVVEMVGGEIVGGIKEVAKAPMKVFDGAVDAVAALWEPK